MIYPNGKVETTPNGMANVFRQFYEEFYASKGPPPSKDKTTPKARQQAKLPKVTITEVDKALK